MIDQFCPNPAIAQRLYAGPLGAHIDTFAHRFLAQGYESMRCAYSLSSAPGCKNKVLRRLILMSGESGTFLKPAIATIDLTVLTERR